MNKEFKIVTYPRNNERHTDISAYNEEEAKKVYNFHKSFAVYTETPLVKLDHLAKRLGVNAIMVKDESYRFGLNAFKVLGGSYAMGKYIASELGEDISAVSATKMISDEVKAKLGDLTFVSATDGNHGRGVAWTAQQLKQNSVIYMPRGSATERLENIRAHGSKAEIMDMNYDEAVRLANQDAIDKGYIVVQDTAWDGYEEIPQWIMQGYMTLGYETVQQLLAAKEEQPTHIFLQAGVGSLAGGLCGFFANVYKDNQPKIVVVEPNTVDCIYRTAKANDGKLHFVTGDLKTIMAGLACGEPNKLGWDVLKGYADAFIAAPDYSAADGMRILGCPIKGDTQIVSGESGAAPLGCIANILLDEKLAHMKEELAINENSRLLFVNTEGDTDRENYENVTWLGKHNKY